jgi:hypothetical protein
MGTCGWSQRIAFHYIEGRNATGTSGRASAVPLVWLYEPGLSSGYTSDWATNASGKSRF